MKEDQLKNFNFDELDKEIGLGDLLTQKESWVTKFLKRLAYLILLLTIGIMVFFASFSIGNILFMSEPQASYENSIYANKSPLPTIIPSVDIQIEKTEEFTFTPEKTALEEPSTITKTEPLIVPVEKEEIKQPEATKTFTLIAGTFSLKNNADKLNSQLKGLGFTSSISEIIRNNITYYRVVAGTYANENLTKEKQSVLKNKGIDSIYISN